MKLNCGGRRLTDLRFADDVILFSTSRRQLTNMLCDMQSEAEKTGLELHPDKTKILHNQQHRTPHSKKEFATVSQSKIEILPYTASQKYLGTKFTFDKPHEAEVEHRIAAGWRKFYQLKRELTTRTYSLRGRLRLFHGTITPTVLYGSVSWTLTQELSNRFRQAQRQMLRMIVGTPRRHRHAQHTDTNTSTPSSQPPQTRNSQNEAPQQDSASDKTETESSLVPEEEPVLEPWSDWIRRCTHDAERHLQRMNIQDWPTIQQQKKRYGHRRLVTRATNGHIQPYSGTHHYTQPSTHTDDKQDQEQDGPTASDNKNKHE